MEDSKADWTILPDLVLLKIYMYLSDADRRSMSLVCKNWHRMFESPMLWRTRRIVFGTRKSCVTTFNALGFLSAFGKNLRTLTTSFASPSYRDAKVISKSVETFFKRATCVADLNLQEFTLHYANMETYWHFILSKNRIVSSLCRFLRRQHELLLINLIAARMSLSDGCRVLESLGRGNASKTLKTMFIEDMFQRNLTPVLHNRYVKAMSKFKNVTWVYTNYDTVNGDILKSISLNVGNRFQKLTLTIDNVVSHTVIGSTEWDDFSSHCGNAEVVFYIYASAFCQDVSSILVSPIPMTEINIVSWPATEESRQALGSQIAATIKRVAIAYGLRLECLTLHLDRNPTIDDELIHLLNRCKKLHELNLCCRLQVQTVKRICQMQKDGFIDLHTLSLAIHGLSQAEWKFLSEVKGELIQAINSHVIRSQDSNSSTDN